MTEFELERLLALGLILVYWLDATRLLRSNEALVELQGAGRWRVSFGLVGFELRGRRLCWPNLARPDRASTTVRWTLSDSPDADSAPSDAWDPQQNLAMPPARWLGRFCLVSLVLVVLCGPILLWLGRAQAFAVAILLALALNLVAGAYLVRHARSFGRTRTNALGLALIAVVCLPCAPNLLRAAVGRGSPSVTLPGFARAGVTDAGWDEFRERFARVLGAQEAYLTPGSRDHVRTQAVLSDMRRAGV
jgi:hypothetical protein